MIQWPNLNVMINLNNNLPNWDPCWPFMTSCTHEGGCEVLQPLWCSYLCLEGQGHFQSDASQLLLIFVKEFWKKNKRQSMKAVGFQFPTALLQGGTPYAITRNTINSSNNKPREYYIQINNDQGQQSWQQWWQWWQSLRWSPWLWTSSVLTSNIMIHKYQMSSAGNLRLDLSQILEKSGGR